LEITSTVPASARALPFEARDRPIRPPLPTMRWEMPADNDATRVLRQPRIIDRKVRMVSPSPLHQTGRRVRLRGGR